MSLVSPIKDNDPISIRQAIAKLGSIKLGPTSSPTYAGLTLTGLTASRLVASNASNALVSTDLNSWVAGTANEINITDDGDGTITIGIVDPLIIGKGGTGAATFTDHSILLGSGTDALTALGAATNGQLPIGSTGADPVLATLTAGTGIDITNGAGTISIATTVTQYTDELAQDAVGGILDDGTVGNIVFTYDDAGNSISAVTQDGEIDHDALANTHNLTTDIDHDQLTNVHQDVNTDAIPIFGGLTIDGTGSILVPSHWDYTTPTIRFGDGDTGISELSDDTIVWLFGGLAGNTIMRAGQFSMGGFDPAWTEFSINHATSATFSMYVNTVQYFKIQCGYGNTEFNNYIGNVSFNNVANSYIYFSTANTQRFSIGNTGGIIIGFTSDMDGLIHIQHAAPDMNFHNDTHEDTDGGRESRINFKGEQSGGEKTTLARIEASHDGAADDEKGKIGIYTNDGNDTDSPTLRVTIDSTGATDVVGDFTAGTIQADDGWSGSFTNGDGATVTVLGGIITGVV